MRPPHAGPASVSRYLRILFHGPIHSGPGTPSHEDTILRRRLPWPYAPAFMPVLVYVTAALTFGFGLLVLTLITSWIRTSVFERAWRTLNAEGWTDQRHRSGATGADLADALATARLGRTAWAHALMGGFSAGGVAVAGLCFGWGLPPAEAFASLAFYHHIAVTLIIYQLFLCVDSVYTTLDTIGVSCSLAARKPASITWRERAVLAVRGWGISKIRIGAPLIVAAAVQFSLQAVADQITLSPSGALAVEYASIYVMIGVFLVIYWMIWRVFVGDAHLQAAEAIEARLSQLSPKGPETSALHTGDPA